MRRLTPWIDWIPVLVAIPLYFAGLDWGYGPESSWSWDEPRPAEIVAEPYDSPPSWPTKYPLLHRDILRVAFAPVAWVGRNAQTVVLDQRLFLVGRALSVLLALITLRLVFLVARELGGRRAAWLAALFWIACLPQTYYAKTMNLEAPYLFWFALAVFAFVRFRSEALPAWALRFGVAAGAAMLTKDQAYGLFVLPVLLLATEGFRSGERRRRIGLGLLAAAAAIGMACLSYRLGSGTTFLVRHLEAVAAHPETYAFTSSDSRGLWNGMRLAGRHLAWSFGAPLAIVLALASASSLFAALRRRDPSSKRLAALLLFPVSYLLVVLLPLGYQYDRFLLPVGWILAVVAGCEIARWWAADGRRVLRYAGIVLFALAFAWGLARAVAIDLAMVGDRRFALERSTRGATRIAYFVHPVRAPQGFDRLQVRRGDRVPLDALSTYDVVAIPAQDLGEPALARLANALRSGECGFAPADPELAAPSRLARFPGFEGVLSNLSEIDPPLRVFRRPPPLTPCGVDDSAEPVR